MAFLETLESQLNNDHLALKPVFSMSSREQLAVAKFAQCLQVIPKTLAINAALDAADLVSKLRAFHNESQCNEARAGFRFCGLDLVKGCIRDNNKAGKVYFFLF